VRAAIADVVRPGHFFVGAGMDLAWEHHPDEVIPWELFRGRLLDRTQSRAQRIFEAWNIYLVQGELPSGEPLLALKLDWAAGEIHATRGILCHVWEGYDSGGGVYLSRETTRWTRELVGTARLSDFADGPALRSELARLLFRAVVGTSRLPLTSVEAPLPGFTLGTLAYFYRPDAPAEPMRHRDEVLTGAWHAGLSPLEVVKAVEFLLRCAPPDKPPDVVEGVARRWSALHPDGTGLPALLRALFDEVSLSPWTDFVEKALALVRGLTGRGVLTAAQQVDFLGHLLRQSARHLTAYDLVNFHHNGANYPDALLLDLVLKEYLALIERHPGLFSAGEGRRRRRALRQGWLVRRHYEGHLVPDAPTSPGESARVLPEPHRRVPDEQLTSPLRRTRRLYDGDPLPAHLGEHARAALRESAADLDHPDELRELGMAVFIDRPLGTLKAPAEPDQTVLFAYEAFSRAVARRRLDALAADAAFPLDADGAARHGRALEVLPLVGVPVARVGREPRPVVSLNDARRVSEDFLLLRTLPRGVREFLRQWSFDDLGRRFDLRSLGDAGPLLVVRDEAGADGPALAVYDAEMRKRLQLGVCGEGGYVARGGAEWPAAGLCVLRIWDLAPDGATVEHDLRREDFRLLSR
jgi:hypothetical protein